MRLLVVFCHPSSESFGAALFETACRTLRAAGHELRVHDLYREGFDPVLNQREWDDYLLRTRTIIDRNPGHIEDLIWSEGLVVIYPTWFYGPPAMLKGWLERVWLPGVAFEVADARLRRPKGKLGNIRLFVGITTSGSPWWWLRIIRDPGRNLWTRGLRPLLSPKCRVIWRQLYDMNNTSERNRVGFLACVERTLQRIPV